MALERDSLWAAEISHALLWSKHTNFLTQCFSARWNFPLASVLYFYRANDFFVLFSSNPKSSHTPFCISLIVVSLVCLCIIHVFLQHCKRCLILTWSCELAVWNEYDEIKKTPSHAKTCTARTVWFTSLTNKWLLWSKRFNSLELDQSESISEWTKSIWITEL